MVAAEAAVVGVVVVVAAVVVANNCHLFTSKIVRVVARKACLKSFTYQRHWKFFCLFYFRQHPFLLRSWSIFPVTPPFEPHPLFYGYPFLLCFFLPSFPCPFLHISFPLLYCIYLFFPLLPTVLLPPTLPKDPLSACPILSPQTRYAFLISYWHKKAELFFLLFLPTLCALSQLQQVSTL